MSGKRILLTTFGSFGDLHPYLAVGLELKARGIDAIIGTSEFYRAKVQSSGLEFAPLRPDLPSSSESAEFARRVMDPRRGTEVVIRELALGHLRDSYEDLSRAAAGCDLIVSHALTYASPIVAERMNIPWVFVALQPVILFSAEDPSIPPHAPWVVGLRRSLGAVGYRALMDLGMMQYAGWAEPIRRLRADLGLASPLDNPILRGQYSPHLNLALFSRALALAANDWPARTVQTGFAFYDTLDAMQPPMSEELTRFLAAGDAPIVFTLGTAAVRHAGDFFEQSVETARLLKRRAVILTGVETGNADGLVLPEGVIAVDYAPYGELFSQASAIVHQGGIGTTGQAIRAGKPMLVVPFAHDQLDNAARCVSGGFALSVSKSRYTWRQAADKLSLLLDALGYRLQASAAGEIVSWERGASAACDALCKLLV